MINTEQLSHQPKIYSTSEDLTNRSAEKLTLLINPALENLENDYQYPRETLVKKWSISSGNVKLFMNPQTKECCVEIKKEGRIHRVTKEDISGLPKQSEDSLLFLERYLQGTAIRLSTIQGNGYKIYITHGLKGGMHEPSHAAASSNSTSPGRLTRDLIEKLQVIVKTTDEALREHCNPSLATVALVGVTGAGKSTAINHLSGLKVQVIREPGPLKGKIVVAPGQEALTEVGHSFIESQTKIAKFCHKPGAGYAFIDCGGFLETRGPATEIEVMTSMKLTLQNQINLRVMICIDYNELFIARGQKIAETTKMVLTEFLANYRLQQNSVLVVLTKPPMLGDEEPPRYATTQDGKAIIKRILKEIEEKKDRNESDEDLYKLYRFILRQKGKYFAVYNPRSDVSRDEILNKLDAMSPIIDTRNAFRLAYSYDTRHRLEGEMSAIANHGLQLLRRLRDSESSIERYRKERDKQQEKVEKIELTIQKLENNRSNDSQEIKVDESQMKDQQLQIIAENEENIRIGRLAISQSEENIKELETNRLQREKKGTKLVKNGEESFDPMTCQFDLDLSEVLGKNVFTDWLQKNILNPLIRPRNIKKIFTYHGSLELKEVRKSPSDATWINESFSPDRKVYSITYNSGDREQRTAKVKYYVEKRLLPKQTADDFADQQSILAEMTKITQLTLDQTRYELNINNANATINGIHNKEDKLQLLETSKKNLETALEEANINLKEVQAVNIAIAQEIELSKEDFKFLRSYLELSNDRDLGQNSAVNSLMSKWDELFPHDTLPISFSSSSSSSSSS